MNSLQYYLQTGQVEEVGESWHIFCGLYLMSFNLPDQPDV